jgi:O-methyltransferase
MVAVGRLQPELARVMPSAQQRRELLRRMRGITANVPCPHNESHVLQFIVELLKLPPETEGVVIEAGCFRGGSTAKLSIAASRAGRDLVVFDSFQGLPANNEQHDKSILGHSIDGWFSQGEFAGRLDEVRGNVRRFGHPELCRFVPGWFEDTMSTFNEPIAAAYIDVDLASSTRTCLKQLYPLLSPGGFLLSQDGDFPLVIDVLKDHRFWESEVGSSMPPMTGVGTSKMVMIRKPADAGPSRADQPRRGPAAAPH